jgi:hypothetical protein
MNGRVMTMALEMTIHIRYILNDVADMYIKALGRDYRE